MVLQACESLDEARPERIEVYVANQRPEVPILRNHDRAKAILEQVPGAGVAMVEPTRVAPIQPGHHAREGTVAGAENQMHVVGHQGPGETASAALLDLSAQSIEEVLPISIVVEDASPLDSA
jgi:hypothetical protein